ncbi:negative regulator of sigma-B (phosphoserine phosphatase) [Pullulanibacillus pueri]|uniref:Phosphoserine phosphatase RsbX n=1 Tax=Pullulanibacillus pueri TaxID=1437324 RepID=A0A8J3END2_9BACL|nr:protein phosphatase 2C domain-containing protein [Pullulanibacillus pueri]MBM7683789.1 negative regulator of sigma-B (phosphoserine phosphatase) [Pullulanibacillus pueri]GGH87601.1 phosphoserine phosphatase RsbX [Pullulanibacillus pueri]
MIEAYPFANFIINAFQKSKKGKECNGDSFLIDETDDAFFCAVADGLGSGGYARKASQMAVEVIERSLDQPLDEIMRRVNDSQQGLRGVVLSIFRLDTKTRMMEFCGVGNISFNIYKPNGEIVHPLPKQGYLSGRVMDFRIQSFLYPDDAWFAIYSDGIYLNSKHAPTIKRLFYSSNEKEAEMIMESISTRFVDDMTVVIGKPS